MAAERVFRAMGTDASVTVVGADSLVEAAVERIASLEALWSRFSPTSEISALNSAGGHAHKVSPDTRRLVQTAIDAWTTSAGFVDCTMLDDLVAAGYERSFDALLADLPAPSMPRRRLVRLVGPTDIQLDGDTVTLPAGVQFDPGGIGKGLAADIVAEEVMAGGAEGVCVNLGGDLRVRGANPQGRAWTISIDHPAYAAPLAMVGLCDGAVASSTTLLRRWRVGGVLRHHLIDPRTGDPADSGIAFAAAIARSAAHAEVMAKAVLIRGGPTPFDLIDGSGIESLVVYDDGVVATSRDFERFTGGAVAAPSPAGLR